MQTDESQLQQTFIVSANGLFVRFKLVRRSISYGEWHRVSRNYLHSLNGTDDANCLGINDASSHCHLALLNCQWSPWMLQISRPYRSVVQYYIVKLFWKRTSFAFLKQKGNVSRQWIIRLRHTFFAAVVPISADSIFVSVEFSTKRLFL